MRGGYPSNWDEIRRQVYRRDEYTCQNCGAQGGSRGGVELHAHHIVPVSSGGTHQIDNLTTMCKACHDAIHTDAMAPTAGVVSQSVGHANTNALGGWYYVKDKSRSEIKVVALTYHDELLELDNFSDVKVDWVEAMQDYFKVVEELQRVRSISQVMFEERYADVRDEFVSANHELAEKANEIENLEFDGLDRSNSVIGDLARKTKTCVLNTEQFINTVDCHLETADTHDGHETDSPNLLSSPEFDEMYTAAKQLGDAHRAVDEYWGEVFGHEGEGPAVSDEVKKLLFGGFGIGLLIGIILWGIIGGTAGEVIFFLSTIGGAIIGGLLVKSRYDHHEIYNLND